MQRSSLPHITVHLHVPLCGAQVPYGPYNGKLSRVPLDSFDTASVEVLDLPEVTGDGDLRGFSWGSFAYNGFG